MAKSKLQEIQKGLSESMESLYKGINYRRATIFLCFVCGTTGATRSRLPFEDPRKKILDANRDSRVPQDESIRSSAETLHNILGLADHAEENLDTAHGYGFVQVNLEGHLA